MTETGCEPTDRSLNVCVLRGVLAADVRVSALPTGGVVHNFELKTSGDGERHVVPVAWHDPVRPARLVAGDEVVVTGSVRRRWFRAAGASQSRTEVVARSVARSASGRARTAFTDAVAMLRTDEVPER